MIAAQGWPILSQRHCQHLQEETIELVSEKECRGIFRCDEAKLPLGLQASERLNTENMTRHTETKRSF